MYLNALTHINDRVTNTPYSIRLFANDSSIYRKITHHSHIDILKSDLNSICKWCDTTQMQLHTTNHKIMLVSHHVTPLATYQFTFPWKLSLVTKVSIFASPPLRSKLEYTATIWDPARETLRRLNSVEMVHIRAARLILGSYPRTPSLTSTKAKQPLPKFVEPRKFLRLSFFIIFTLIIQH